MVRANAKTGVIVAVIVFVALHIVFSPSFFASIDEHEYLKNAFLLQKGTLAEPEQTQSCEGQYNGKGYVSQYFVGRSLFLIPFTWFGFDSVLLSGLVIHIINLFLFFTILKKIGYSPLYSLFYLLYPAFLWEARTLNSELLALSGILAGVYFYLSEKPAHSFLAGLFFGLAALPRYEAVLIGLSFFLIPLLQRRRKFLHMVAGFIPAAAIILTINTLFYGGVLENGYSQDSGQIFSIGSNPIFLQNFGKFIFLISVAYPLMLFSPLVAKKLRKETIIASLFYIIFYSQNANISQFGIFTFTAFTAQLRYIIPLLGLIMLSYPSLVEKIISRIRLPLRPTLLVVCAVLFFFAIVASSVHASFLDGRRAIFDQIYANTKTGSLLIGSSDDCNYVLSELFDDRSYLDVGNKALEEEIAKYEDAYILDISYRTVDYSSVRGQMVAAERQPVKEFIEKNQERLARIFEAGSPHHLSIYRLEVQE